MVFDLDKLVIIINPYLKQYVFFGLLDPDPDLLVRDTDPEPNPSFIKQPVLRIWIRDPGSGAFLTPGSGIRDPE